MHGQKNIKKEVLLHNGISGQQHVIDKAKQQLYGYGRNSDTRKLLWPIKVTFLLI